MFELIAKDFKNAPLWQKIVLLVLLGILFFHIFVRSGLVLFSKKIDQLDRQRDFLFKKMQTLNYLLEDEKVIRKNYKLTEQAVLGKLINEKEMKTVLYRIIVLRCQKILSLEFIKEPEQTYQYFDQKTLRVKAVLQPGKVAELISVFDQLPYLELKNIDYQNGLINFELKYFCRKNLSGSSNTGAQKLLNTEKPKIRKNYLPATGVLQGFYTQHNKTQAIINSKLYSIGGKCGKYTIIDINPQLKYIVMKTGGRKKIVKQGHYI